MVRKRRWASIKLSSLKLSSLRSKLVASYLVVALLPIALLAGISRQAMTKALTHNANQALFAAASQTALRLDGLIQRNLDAVRVEAQIPVFARYLQLPPEQQSSSREAIETAETLKSLAQRDSLNVLSYSLIDLQGKTVVDTYLPDINHSRAEADFFQQPLATDAPYASSLHIQSPQDGISSFYFSSPVRDADGKILGILAVRYNAIVLQQIIHQSQNLAGSESFSIVLDEYHIRILDGSRVGQQFKSLMPLPLDRIKLLQQQERLPNFPIEQLTTNQPDFDQALHQSCSVREACPPIYVTTKIPGSDRHKRLAAVRMQKQPWFVAFYQPEEVFLAPIAAQTRTAIALTLGIAILVSIAALAIAHWLSKPLNALAEGVNQFTEGNLEARVHNPSHDEIGILSANFNLMAEQVSKLLSGLEDRTVELEGSRYITFAVSELSKSILDGDRLLQEAVKLVQEGFAARDVQIYLWDEATTQLHCRARALQGGADLAASPHIPMNQDCLVAIAARRFQPQMCHDLAKTSAQARQGSEVAVPLISRGILLGVLDIQDSSADRFSENDQETFTTLAGQIATALENAQLFQTLQTTEAQYRDKAQELQQTLEALQQAQAKLVQSEKMSSLGQLVAGVAHEINNPINFIYANLTYLNQYQIDLFKLLQLYQHHYPQPCAEIKAEQDHLDLAFVTKDFSQILTSMKVGAERVRKIVLSLRNFSRLDESEVKLVNIHEGIDSTLVMLQSQLKESNTRPAIEVTKEYGSLPLVECYAGQLNQVFMNLLLNAIDALESRVDRSRAQKVTAGATSPKPSEPLKITIKTELSDQEVVIRIIDNGTGITAATRQKLFDPFFTTKDVGKGTGLGLSVSYQIVTEKHQGHLFCNSESGKGAEFVVQIPIALQVKKK
jgi:signal transduction histidine kinase/HAMP domain-containing protein